MSGLVVAIMYVIFRFIEMRFILKENKPLKVLFRDTIIDKLISWFDSSDFESKIKEFEAQGSSA